MPGVGGGGNEKIVVKEYKLTVIKLTNSEDLRYSLVIIANNTVSYLNVAKRLKFKCSHHKKEMIIM